MVQGVINDSEADPGAELPDRADFHVFVVSRKVGRENG